MLINSSMSARLTCGRDELGGIIDVLCREFAGRVLKLVGRSNSE